MNFHLTIKHYLHLSNLFFKSVTGLAAYFNALTRVTSFIMRSGKINQEWFNIVILSLCRLFISNGSVLVVVRWRLNVRSLLLVFLLCRWVAQLLLLVNGILLRIRVDFWLFVLRRDSINSFWNGSAHFSFSFLILFNKLII